MKRSKYLTFSLSKQNFASYPAGLSLADDVWMCYPLRGGQKLKRLLRFLNRQGLDNFFLKKTVEPFSLYNINEQSFQSWLKSIINDESYICFFWPAPARSLGRFYAYALNAGARISAYLKFAVGPNDCEALQREIKASELLAQNNIETFQFPHCLGYRNFGSDCLVSVFEALPSDQKTADFSLDSWQSLVGNCKKEFAEEVYPVSISVLEKERWFQKFQESADDTPFVKSVLSTMVGTIDVCKTHGDFACHNFRVSDNRLWLFDWEEFTAAGPCLTDEICFFLCVRHFELAWPIEKVFQDFASSYLQKNELMYQRALQALAFLFALKISMGQKMAEYWNQNHNSFKFYDIKDGN